MRALVWFRSDLRTVDNRALHSACRDADRGVVGVYTVCPKQWQSHDCADIKVEFILRNLACLSERLKRLNIPLLVANVPTFGDVPAAIRNIAKKHNCDALYYNREYEVNERRRDDAVEQTLCKDDMAIYAFEDQTILPPNEVRTKEGAFYKVFTPFKRAWLDAVDEDLMAPLPDPRPQAEMICAPDSIPEQIAGFDLSMGQPDRWPAGEGIAAEWLGRFVDDHIRAYKKDRDLPALNATSRLSPYLAAGVMSPRQCIAAAREVNRDKLAGGRVGPDTWISEIVWREFYRHVLVGFPRVSMNQPFKPESDDLPWRYDEGDFHAWCDGRTGVPIVDAAMRQLAQTGWMHNRLRMIAAMYLTKDLFIDWRWGERHFMRHLIDGDLASNNGGWQWSASTGTDAAPYFRIFNPVSQSKKCDPDGEFIRRYVPELHELDGDTIHDPDRWPDDLRHSLDYPDPICDHAAARERTLAAFKALK